MKVVKLNHTMKEIKNIANNIEKTDIKKDSNLQKYFLFEPQIFYLFYILWKCNRLCRSLTKQTHVVIFNYFY